MTSLVFVAIFVVALVIGLRFRLGPKPRQAEVLLTDLRRPGMPRVVGNVMTAAIPAGASLISIIVGLRVGGTATYVGVVVGLLLALVTAWFAWRPPRWAKASWLVEDELSGRLPIQPVGWFDKVVLGSLATFTVISLGFVLALIIRPIYS